MTTIHRAFRVCCIGFVLATAFVVPCRAKLIETTIQVPVTVKNAFQLAISQPITVTVFVDDETPQPRPVMVINHGRAVNAAERAAIGRVRFSEPSRHYARLGFIVAVPTRIGYGASGGDDVEDSGACSRKVYPPGYLAAAEETRTVLDTIGLRSDARKDRSVVIGQSYGGATSVAVASLNLPGVVAAVNFAGGGGGNPKTQPQQPCAPELLARMFGEFGRSAKVPMLWVYTENDMYFGPRFPQEWFKAYRAHGAPAEMTQFPPHGDDGHLLFSRFFADWQPVVDSFLNRQGFDLKPRP